MATQTGSTYISYSTTVIIKIPTATWSFRSRRAQSVFWAIYDNDRQPEMAAETTITYVSETMKDTIQISTANPAFSPMAIGEFDRVLLVARRRLQRPCTLYLVPHYR